MDSSWNGGPVGKLTATKSQKPSQNFVEGIFDALTSAIFADPLCPHTLHLAFKRAFSNLRCHWDLQLKVFFRKENLENLVLCVAFTMGKASSLDLSADFCKPAFHGGLVSHMQNVLTSTGTSSSFLAT